MGSGFNIREANMATAKKSTVELKPLDLKEISFTIEGETPLIVHAWSHKAREMMLAKQIGKVVKKEFKDPEADYEASKYTLNGKPAFPAICFKLAAIRGAKSLGLVMADMRGAFRVHGVYDDKQGREMVPVLGNEYTMREDMVRLETGVADIRYRAEVKNWSVVLKITYNAGMVTPEHLVNMFQAAGFGCGIGEWRPERNGEFGTFHVKVN